MRLTTTRLLLAIAVVLSALVLQVVVLSRLGLPGASPDLLLVVVLALGMAAGPGPGAIFGFSAGLLVELAPPASGSIGQTAAVYAVAGFFAGQLALEPGRPEVRTVAAIGGIAGAAVIAQAILAAVIGTPQVNWGALPLLVLTQMLYAAALSFLVMPLMGALYRGADEGYLA